jgi:hypothetical protein
MYITSLFHWYHFFFEISLFSFPLFSFFSVVFFSCKFIFERICMWELTNKSLFRHERAFLSFIWVPSTRTLSLSKKTNWIVLIVFYKNFFRKFFPLNLPPRNQSQISHSKMITRTNFEIFILAEVQRPWNWHNFPTNFHWLLSLEVESPIFHFVYWSCYSLNEVQSTFFFFVFVFLCMRVFVLQSVILLFCYS